MSNLTKPCYCFILMTGLLMTSTIHLYAADKVEFTLESSGSTDIQAESFASESIDSTQFDKAFVDPQAKKARQTKKVVLKKTSLPPKKKALANKQVASGANKSEKEKVQNKSVAAATVTAHKAAAPETTQRPSSEDYLQKVIKVVIKSYKQGSAVVEDWANKLKMKWQRSAK